MSKKITFKKDEKNITITIPIKLLKWAGEHHPEDPIIVHDEQQFAEKVMFELENNLGSVESGYSGFEELLDEAMLEVAQGGYDFVDLKETEW